MNADSRGVAWLADSLTVVFLGIIAVAAIEFDCPLIFFPELGALAFDVFRNPRGKWASSPWFLMLTPPLTGVLGVAITSVMPYGFVSMLLVVVGCVGIVRWLRSPVAPAISAGVLPLVMGIDSWIYPVAILFGTVLLAIGSLGWRVVFAAPEEVVVSEPESHKNRQTAVGVLAWRSALLAFVSVSLGLVSVTDWRLILFPPLVVIAYEMLVHPRTCPWALQPLKLPIVCTTTAAVGVISVTSLGAGLVSTVVALTAGILVLRLAGIAIPPALAVALIPQIVEVPDWRYPLSVGIGCLLLVVAFRVYRTVTQPENEHRDDMAAESHSAGQPVPAASAARQ